MQQPRTRVKICGITRSEDLEAAVAVGADAVGFVFYPPSPRAVGIEQAAALCQALKPFVSAVGLFVDARPEEIEAVLAQVPLDLLQFHGDEPPELCRRFGRRWIKAIRMRPDIDLEAEYARFVGTAGLLLDAYDPNRPGGTGQRFDWGLIPPRLASKIILAGGLDARNVAEAIAQVRPYGVDVSGGVERAKGIKDPERMASFMRAVRDGDRRRAGIS
ncbi:phosphoribosylanthranilate isomerase [Caldichromatium japonicum]|uniref:N-(5'-phosphoribosyl)anthranilate isomerase n=1 Tax=Caldichromatium japonicum TaxID=2699430 RepID=A0A6G7VGQ3_9GAMM|nr:phosphoribosylanthranilate isomerase [Caldichromatium japonicum]QIK39045.1 phosphoribosylanthranilate isomerase [Caldichromatium japonicum]